MAKEVVPKLGLESYSCPHCGALAHQFWFNVYPSGFERDKRPDAYTIEDVVAYGKLKRNDDDQREKVDEFVERFKKNEVTYIVNEYENRSVWQMVNLFLSRCHSCEGFSIWIRDKIAWPVHSINIEPHPEMPALVKDDFIEASTIVGQSPRGSAALSRLLVQKLMVSLGESGKDLNADIASLVKKGLEPEIQKALDIVRVTGNNAVHPGQIDLKDDIGTATALLQLINLVVERRIATAKRIEEMFASLPPNALEQIEKRDTPKQIEDKTGG